LKDAEMLAKMKMDDIDTVGESTVLKLKSRHSELLAQLEIICEQSSKEMKDIQSDHDKDLDDLDAEVKRSVAAKDEELAVLRDAVETEKVRMGKLEKMVKRYSINVP
jgi:hypothetical protein